MWFNLYSCNLHSWIIPSKASICLNFGLFFKHLFNVNGNQVYMHMVLHYRFPGLQIKQVHLMQRHSRGFCSLWSCCCCLYLSCRFCPATLCSTLIFAGSFLPCSKVFALGCSAPFCACNCRKPHVSDVLTISWLSCCSPVASLCCQEFSKLSQQCFTAIPNISPLFTKYLGSQLLV